MQQVRLTADEHLVAEEADRLPLQQSSPDGGEQDRDHEPARRPTNLGRQPGGGRGQRRPGERPPEARLPDELRAAETSDDEDEVSCTSRRNSIESATPRHQPSDGARS